MPGMSARDGVAAATDGAICAAAVRASHGIAPLKLNQQFGMDVLYAAGATFLGKVSGLRDAVVDGLSGFLPK